MGVGLSAVSPYLRLSLIDTRVCRQLLVGVKPCVRHLLGPLVVELGVPVLSGLPPRLVASALQPLLQHWRLGRRLPWWQLPHQPEGWERRLPRGLRRAQSGVSSVLRPVWPGSQPSSWLASWVAWLLRCARAYLEEMAVRTATRCLSRRSSTVATSSSRSFLLGPHGRRQLS